MKKALLALTGAAVALTGLSAAAPAEARTVRTKVCTQWRHHVCVRSRTVVRHTNNRGYRVGYRFGPSYGYTSYSAIPRTYVQRYNLSPRYRYVYNPGGPVYVVDPTTYAITRVLNSL